MPTACTRRIPKGWLRAGASGALWRVGANAVADLHKHPTRRICGRVRFCAHAVDAVVVIGQLQPGVGFKRARCALSLHNEHLLRVGQRRQRNATPHIDLPQHLAGVVLP